jgi:AraC-like DNA-binding protein
MPAVTDASIVRFRMNEMPAGDSFEAWREIVGRAVMRLEIERVKDRRCFGDVTLRALPGLGMSSGATTGMQFRRPRALLDSDDLIMHVSLAGGFRGHQRDLTLAKGEAVLLPSAEPGLVSLVDECFLIFRIPLRVMSPIVGDLDSVLGKPIPKDTEALRLLVNYAEAISQSTAPTKPDVRHLVVSHVHDLIALALGATRDAAETAKGRGLRAARLSAIETYIARHLGEANLSIQRIAARNGVTPRYVQMLFETKGTTFSEFVRDSRLLRAHRMLTDPRYLRRSIISVALEAGFQDLSYFNRTFRRRFGDTPSGVRAAASD